MWVWLRRMFFALMWLGVLTAGWGIWRMWQSFPARILGVGWVWAAVAAWIAMAAIALDAVLEIGPMPLPPEVSPEHEIRRWGLFLIAGPTVGVIFAFDVFTMVVAVHAVMQTLSWLPKGVLASILTALVIAWLMGTFYVLAWMSESDWVERLHRLRYRLLGLYTSEQDILKLLDDTDLPDRIKTAFAKRIQRRGLTPAIAHRLLNALDDPTIAQTITRALLIQSLHNWLEEHDRERKGHVPPPGT